jgi:CRISPR-associated protein Cst2
MATVLKGGNNPLHYVIGADEKGRPTVHTDALKESLRVWGDSMLSKLYIGWVQGFHDAERDKLAEALTTLGIKFQLDHPRVVLSQLAKDVQDPANAHWLE